MGRRIGIIWDEEIEWMREKPFEDEHMNRTYKELSKIAAEKGAEVYITNYRWYEDGKIENAYRYGPENEWHRYHNVQLDCVFDKYKFDDETRELKKQMDVELPVMNRFGLEEICKDKLLSYEKFSDLVPETWEATEDNVKDLFFDNEKVIIKPRYDFGGHGIEIIESQDEFEPGENLLAQAFVDSSAGIPELDVDGVHDLRVLVLNGEIVGSYLRIPEGDGLISNVSMGGTIRFIDVDEIPEKVVDVVDQVREKFNHFNPSFYSVDTIVDEEGDVHVLEFNSKPGLSFYNDEEVEKHKRPIVEKLVETLVEMCDE